MDTVSRSNAGQGTGGGALPRSPMALGERLARAVEADEIEILFQPQFACRDGRMVGAEALARWNHPELGEIGGEALFEAAGQAGVVAAISREIVGKALALAQGWPHSLRLSLNITATELGSPDFAGQFARLLANGPVDPSRITLEITEQLLLGDLDLAAEALSALREAGLCIALDDFGAGFCNFSYLKRLPLDAIKLDRSMVEGVASSEKDRAVLRAIAALADALGLQLVAEGIETRAQLDVVCELGCTSWQGFFGAQPLGNRELVQRMKG